ncbi:MAG: hypothetical protein IJ608_02425 [Lachnospiraceae bacterium]|nr:hypothetical protein [Lachnospiraceae bacterium]
MKKICLRIKKNLINSVILFIMFICILMVWPFGVLHQEVEHRSGDYLHAQTMPLEIGDSMEQTFWAYGRRLKTLAFVLDYDNDAVEGNILFEIEDNKGNSVFSKEISYSDIENYVYFEVETDVLLKRFHTYKYRITNFDIMQNAPRVVYTGSRRQNAIPNLHMDFANERTDGNALTLYRWDSALTLMNGLAVIAFIGIVGFVLMDILTGKEKGCFITSI